MPSAIDPTFVADGSPVSKPAFRDQLLTLRAELDHGGFVVNPTTLAESTTQQALDDVHGAIGGTVATIADLQAVVPVPGLAMEVLGYHTPGDGGGGLFYADMTGAQATDGGTVFHHTGDESAEQSVTGLGYFDLFDPYDLPHSDLAFGTVFIDSEEAGSTISLSDWDMAGHRMNSGPNPIVPWIDHKLGRFEDPSALLAGYLNDRSTTATIRYRTLTQTRRWVRNLPGGHIDVRWFGAQPGTDARNRICWALNAAKRWGKTEVRLNGAYRYRGSIEIPDGVFFGWGSIKMTDGNAVLPLRNTYPTTHPHGENLVVTGAWGHGVLPESGARAWGLIRFELDGNFEGNLEPLQDPTLYNGDLAGVATFAEPGMNFQMTLQNTPIWSGVSHSPHAGRVIPEGQLVTLEDVHIHGTGSNCMTNNANSYVTARNLKLGNSARNHLFYSFHGAVSGLTIYGFAWGAYGKTEGCNIHGFEVNQLVDGRVAHGFAWSNAPVLVHYEGQRWGPDVYAGADDVRWGQRVGLNITGFNIDLDGYPADGQGPLFYYSGQQLSISDGAVLGPKLSDVDQINLIREADLGQPATADRALYCGIKVSRVRLFQRSGCALALTGDKDLHADQSGFEDLSIEDFRGYEDAAPQRNVPIAIIADTQDRGDPKYGQGPRQNHYHRVTMKPAGIYLAQVDVKHADAHPIDAHFSECVFPLTANAIFWNGGSGTVAGLTVQDTGKIRVFMDRCRFTVGGDTIWADLELFFALTRFRGCATLDGLVSEESGEATLTASGGETSIDVMTSLFWAPGPIHITPRSAAAAARFAYVEVLASDAASAIAGAADKRQPVLRLHFDQPLSAGAVVALGWDAAVRPY